MKKLFLPALTIFLFGCSHLSAQTLTVNELVRLSNSISTLYDTSPTGINGEIDNYISKGFMLDEYEEFKTTATSVVSTYFSLVNTDATNNEQITIQTDNIPPQGSYPQRKICSIEFFTSDIATFQKWYSDLSTNSAYTRVLHGIVLYNYTYGFKSIQVGEIATRVPPAVAGQTISSYIKRSLAGKAQYYIFIQYAVN